jgi:predicted PurR-regulated permease PerM
MKIPFVAKIALVLISLVIIVYGAYILQETLQILAFSFLLAMLLYPLCRKLESWKLPRVTAIFVCLILLTSSLVLMGYLIVNQILDFSDQMPLFTSKMEALTSKTQTWASRNFHISRAKQMNEVKKYSMDLVKNSASYLSSFLSSAGNTLANIAIVPIFVFFIMLYRDFFRHFFYRVFGRVKRANIDHVLSKIYAVVQGYLAGLFLVILIVAALNTLGLWLLDIDYALFFGILAAVLLLIPYIGIMIGSILPILFALITKDSALSALGVAGVFGFVQMLEGNFITPHIVGSKVSINPLAAMVALILGGQLWGIGGLVLALPLTAILKVVLDSVDGLKPYGFLLGDPEQLLQKARKRALKIVETEPTQTPED